MKVENELIQKTIQTVREDVKKTDEFLPMFFVGNESKNETAIVATPFTGNNREEVEMSKDFAAKQVELIAQKMGATFILFISESWILVDQEGAKDYFHNKAKYGYSIQNHPKAIEAVTFMLETETGARMGYAKIHPNREMGEVEWMEQGSTSSGRFSDLLGKKPVVH